MKKWNVFSQYILANFIPAAALIIMEGIGLGSVAQAQVSQLVKIPNASQCAADSKSATESAFLYVDATNAGRIAFQIANQKKYPSDQFVARAITAYKTRLSILAEGVLAKLTSKEWPLINSVQSQIEESLKACRGDLNCLPLKQQFFMLQNKSPLLAKPSRKNSQCLKVEELSAMQSHLFFQGVTQNSLKAMAQQVDLAKSQKSCSDLAAVASQDPSSLLQMDILALGENFDSNGFDVWTSFKTYLSLAWRYSSLPSDDAAFRQIFLNLALEENLMLFSNGCKSITRPECSSDFLTSYQIRRMMISVKDIDPLNMNSEEMRDRLFKPETEEKAFQTSFVSKLADNQWVSDFFKSLSSISWGMTAEIKKSTQFFQALLNKVDPDRMIADLNKILDERGDDQGTLETFHYLCGESNLIGHPEFSFYSFDLENIEKFSRLDANTNSAPIRVREIVSFHKDLYKKLIPVCERASTLAQRQKYNFSKFSNYRPWFKRYLKKYSMFQSLLDSETADVQKSIAPTLANKQNYLQLPSILRDVPALVFCADAIDCSRTVFESIAHLNRIALSSRALLQPGIVSPGIFNKTSDKVACGLINPWEAQELAKKKLFMDMISSVLFGVTRLPIYLDVGFKPGEVTSFQKLIENGKVKFDTKVDQPKMLTSLALHFGSLIGAPCSIQISQTQSGAPAPTTNSDLPGFFFTGITGNACTGGQKGGVDLTGAMSLGESYKQTTPAGQSMCGSCSINFEQVLETSWNQFVPFRFFARMIDSIVRYNNSKDDPSFPHTDIVNLSYLSETYHQYGTIPEKCVAPLSRGLRCMNNLCEALITRDLELATQRKVVAIELEQDNRDGTMPGESYRRAWVQMQGCTRKVPVQATCARDGETYFFRTDRLSNDLYCGSALEDRQAEAR